MTIEHKRRAAKVLAKQTAKTRKRIKDGLATVDVGERADVDIPELPKLPDLSGQFDTLRKLLAGTVRILEFTAQTIKTLNVLMEDVHDTAGAYAALAEDETYPGELIDSIAAGENPVRAFRKYRGMSQAALAEQAGVRQGTVSGIERGHLARVDTVAAIARALGTDIEMLLPRAD